jgi:hypothetical protein
MKRVQSKRKGIKKKAEKEGRGQGHEKIKEDFGKWKRSPEESSGRDESM